jgi:methylated-DNA-protein-cysteine methyltransferase-like protein
MQPNEVGPAPSGRRRSDRWARIWQVVRRIPKGRVATYGQIASLAALPRAARQVGYALHALPDGSGVPWQRVVSARGTVSVRGASGAAARQRRLLEAEGVEFDAAGRIDLAHFQWRPRGCAAEPVSVSTPRWSGPSRRGAGLARASS